MIISIPYYGSDETKHTDELDCFKIISNYIRSKIILKPELEKIESIILVRAKPSLY